MGEVRSLDRQGEERQATRPTIEVRSLDRKVEVRSLDCDGEERKPPSEKMCNADRSVNAVRAPGIPCFWTGLALPRPLTPPFEINDAPRAPL